ncbi:MAG: MCE family protein, partial [Gammaproteobacteria bacterium]
LEQVGTTMAEARALLATVNTDIAPRLAASLAEAESTLAATRAMVATNSVTRTELNRLLIELGDAAEAIAAVAEYLEQHPEALIFGKEKTQ